MSSAQSFKMETVGFGDEAYVDWVRIVDASRLCGMARPTGTELFGTEQKRILS